MARKAHNIHYIYKTTCNVTGKWYVGMHSTSNENDGYMGSGTVLRRSIRKYGVSEHTKEILEYCDSREKLVLREIEIVNLGLIQDELCMNLCTGGEGGHGSKFLTKEQLKKGGQNANKILQEKLKNDPKFKEEISKKLTKKLEDSYRNGERKGFSGVNFSNRVHSDKSKQLISETKQGQGSGETNSQYGTCWMIKDGVCKKVKKDELEDHLYNGWITGRK